MFLKENITIHIKTTIFSQVYAANQVVIEQKQLTDFIYFIAEGHCDCVKMVYLPGCYQRVLLNIGHLETGEIHDNYTQKIYIKNIIDVKVTSVKSHLPFFLLNANFYLHFFGGFSSNVKNRVKMNR